MGIGERAFTWLVTRRRRFLRAEGSYLAATEPGRLGHSAQEEEGSLSSWTRSLNVSYSSRQTPHCCRCCSRRGQWGPIASPASSRSTHSGRRSKHSVQEISSCSVLAIFSRKLLSLVRSTGIPFTDSPDQLAR